MNEADAYLRELDEEIFQKDIQERKNAEKNIANLERWTRLYTAIKDGNIRKAQNLIEKSLDKAYEKARLHYKEIAEDQSTPELRQVYGPEYQKAITSAQKARCPDLFSDS
ncbi:MAG: hypothetical protein NTW67_02620 [Candidatus Woesearchaeota archaeon]|nr:hypothetical protein [Candidatus Woesearchaeota archaeon]